MSQFIGSGERAREREGERGRERVRERERETDWVNAALPHTGRAALACTARSYKRSV